MTDDEAKAAYLAARTGKPWSHEDADKIASALLTLPMRIKCHHCGSYMTGLKHELIKCNECKKSLWE